MTKRTLIAFPVDRETATIRETARILSIRQGAAADRFWQTTQRRLYARLQVQGFSSDEIAAQMQRFANAVFVEMEKAAGAA